MQRRPTHTLRDPIRLPASPSVNKQWAEQAYERHIAKIQSKVPIDVRLTIPDRYPAVRFMNFIDETLYVVRRSRAPDRDFPVLAYTREGKPTTAHYRGHQVPRLAGKVKDRAS